MNSISGCFLFIIQEYRTGTEIKYLCHTYSFILFLFSEVGNNWCFSGGRVFHCAIVIIPESASHNIKVNFNI